MTAQPERPDEQPESPAQPEADVTPAEQLPDPFALESPHVEHDDVPEIASGDVNTALEAFSEAASGTLETLGLAIQRHPDAPSNYVVRGEMYLAMGAVLEAASDFRRALHLAESGAETAAWGFVYSSLADRARDGLRRCGG